MDFMEQEHSTKMTIIMMYTYTIAIRTISSNTKVWPHKNFQSKIYSARIFVLGGFYVAISSRVFLVPVLPTN